MSLEDNQFGPPHRVVAPGDWVTAAADLYHEGYTYFDWLSAVDEHPEGFRMVVHLAKLGVSGGLDDHVLLATMIGRDEPRIGSLTPVFAGASWHERETHEMFGIDFSTDAGQGAHMDPLLLPDGFEGHPLRKEFVLASRVAKPWPGAKEPGEADADSVHSPSRRRLRPPGVPALDEWGPKSSAVAPVEERVGDELSADRVGDEGDVSRSPGFDTPRASVTQPTASATQPTDAPGDTPDD